MPYTLTQVPAKPSHWGLFTFPYGVGGRLGLKVNKIVIHWIDGTLATADLVFTGKTHPERMVSSHFAVEDDQVHQYVSTDNVAWQAGKWLVNLTSVAIEHSAQPGRNATDATYETSSELIVDLCKKLGLVPSRSLLVPHSAIVPDTCPGTIDLDRLAARAVELWNNPTAGVDQPVGGGTPATIASAPSPSIEVPVTFWVTVNSPAGSAHFRNEPTTTGAVMDTYPNGTQIECSATVQGQLIAITDSRGNRITTDRWYKSANHGWYISAAVATHQ